MKHVTSKSVPVNRSGFTIVEILAVTMIIALMAGSVLMFGHSHFKNVVVETTARKLMLAAKYARLSAVEHQVTCRLIISESEGMFFLSYPGDGGQVVSNPYVRPTKINSNVEFESVTITPTSSSGTKSVEGEYVINFMSDGTADMAVMRLTNGKIYYTVTISPATAKAKVYRGKDEDIPIGVIDLDQGSYDGNL